MHIGHSDCAAATAFFIGTNPNNHHLIFRAAEILPFILNTVRQLAYCVEGITDIQFTLVLLYIRGLVKINEKISKCLISPGILFIATPQTDLIELYMLIPPSLPLPIGKASVIQSFAGLSYQSLSELLFAFAV
jgi:hypothetical protein